MGTQRYEIEPGTVFGQLMTVGRAFRAKHGYRVWTVCTCGNLFLAYKASLLDGGTRSCECKKKLGRPKHGKCCSKVYRAWYAMKTRCTNRNAPGYKNYGGRGITICERWQTFENFFADMGDVPPGCSLDRIDNNKGYTPENCRWADRKTQARNRRFCVFLTHDGETKHINEWAEELGISTTTIRSRYVNGWTTEKIVTTKLWGTK